MHQDSDRSSRGERYITLNDEQQWARCRDPLPADEEHAEERHMLKDGEFEKRRVKIASQITGERVCFQGLHDISKAHRTLQITGERESPP